MATQELISTNKKPYEVLAIERTTTAKALQKLTAGVTLHAATHGNQYDYSSLPLTIQSAARNLAQRSPEEIMFTLWNTQTTVVKIEDDGSYTPITPLIEPKAATELELETAQKAREMLALADNPSLQAGMLSIANFLEAPLVYDNMFDHDGKRNVWEAGITSSLRVVDSLRTDGEKEPLDGMFARLWAGNKLSKNSRTKVQLGLQMIAKGLNPNETKRQIIEALLDEMKLENLAARDRENIDEAAEAVSQIAIAAIEVMSDLSQSSNKI